MLKKTSIIGSVMALFVFVMPFFVFGKFFYGPINGRNFLVLGLTYLLALVFVHKVLSRQYNLQIKGRRLLYILLGVFAIYILSALLGEHVGRSFWSDILRASGVIFIGHIGLLAFFLSELLNKDDWIFLRKSFVVASAVFSFFYFFGTEGLGLQGSFITFFNFQYQGAGLGNQTFAGAYILFGIIFTIIEMYKTRRWSRRFWIWGSLLLVQIASPLFFNFRLLSGEIPIGNIISSPSVFLGSARASSTVMFLVVGYLAGRYIVKRTWKDRKLANIAYSGVSLALVVVSMVLLLTPNNPIRDAYVEQSTQARPIVWSAGWHSFKDAPLLGLGPENFEFAQRKYFRSELYFDENLGEIWFDRAHNVFVDTLTTLGAVGFVALMVLLACLIQTFYVSWKRGVISENEANLLSVLLVAHIVQLQTSFDVTPTYFAWALVIGYALWLEKRISVVSDSTVSFLNTKPQKVVIAFLLVAFVLIGSKLFLFDEIARHKSLVAVFRTVDETKRADIIEKSLRQKSGSEPLKMTSLSLIKGSIANFDNLITNEQLLNKVLLEAKIYEEHYDEYIKTTPNDYRARINFAYLLFFETILGNNNLDYAREVIQPAYELSPGNPLTYIMESLSYVYQGDFKKADDILEKGIALNEGVELTQKVKRYVDLQKKSFPTITFLKLENL